MLCCLPPPPPPPPTRSRTTSSSSTSSRGQSSPRIPSRVRPRASGCGQAAPQGTFHGGSRTSWAARPKGSDGTTRPRGCRGPCALPPRGPALLMLCRERRVPLRCMKGFCMISNFAGTIKSTEAATGGRSGCLYLCAWGGFVFKQGRGRWPFTTICPNMYDECRMEGFLVSFAGATATTLASDVVVTTCCRIISKAEERKEKR